MHVPPLNQLASADPEIARLIEAEAERQHDKLRLIPSENYVSTAVLEATVPRATTPYCVTNFAAHTPVLPSPRSRPPPISTRLPP